MAEKYKGKYRGQTFRLRGYDYRREGAYFITMCTKFRAPYFGEIVQEGEAHLDGTIIADFAEKEWLKTPEMRPEMNLMLDEYVFMPDHFHAILCIGANEYNVNSDKFKLNKFGPQRKNLASVVRGFKSSVTTFARKNDMEFQWQKLFHESIIRSEDHYRRVQHYIRNNPSKWRERAIKPEILKKSKEN